MRFVRRISCYFFLMAFIATLSTAQEIKRSASIVEVVGTVKAKAAGSSAWADAYVGMTMNEGDAIKTDASSSAVLILDGTGETSRVEVNAGSEMRLTELVKDKKTGNEKTLLDLAIGQVLIKASKLKEKGSKFEVKTPTSVIGVRGTKFSVKVEAVV
jgi:hypothetical protein